MSTYESVEDIDMAVLTKVRDEHFMELSDARIGMIFDTRDKRKKFIAKIVKANDILRFYSSDEAGEEDGYDYVIIIDQFVWTSPGVTDVDRNNIIRHELRHIDFKPEKKTRKGQYGLKKHDVESFMMELELLRQEGTPNWEQTIKEVAASLYDELEDKESV